MVSFLLVGAEKQVSIVPSHGGNVVKLITKRPPIRAVLIRAVLSQFIGQALSYYITFTQHLTTYGLFYVSTYVKLERVIHSQT